MPAADSQQISFYFGELPRTNQWHEARAIRDPRTKRWRAQIYEGNKYRRVRSLIAAQFGRQLRRIEGYFDVQFTVCMHRLKDSDSFVKGVLDSLEKSGCIEKDNRVRHIMITRHYHPKKAQDWMVMECKPVTGEDLKALEEELKHGFNVENL